MRQKSKVKSSARSYSEQKPIIPTRSPEYRALSLHAFLFDGIPYVPSNEGGRATSLRQRPPCATKLCHLITWQNLLCLSLSRLQLASLLGTEIALSAAH